MPEALSKVLMIAGGAALTCFVIGLLVYAGSQGGALASAVVGNTADVTDSLTDSKINQYKKNTVYGSEVLNAIRKFQGAITVSVSTLDSAGNRTDVSYTGSEELDNVPYLTDGSVNAKYINPYAQFDSDVSINANGVSSGITFTQKKYVAFADTGQLVGDGSSSGSGNGAGSGSGGSGGIDYSTLQDVVNSQSAQIADLVVALESSNAGNSATMQALKDQLSQLSTEQSELGDAVQNLTASMDDLQTLGVKIDSLEAQIVAANGGYVFDVDDTFIFEAGKTYYLSAIACGGAGGTGSCSRVSDWNYTYYNVTPGTGGNRGEYIIRKELNFATNVSASFIIGTNANDGNTIIEFSNGQKIILTKGAGGGGATGGGSSTSGLSGSCHWDGHGGAGGFYATNMKKVSLLDGSGVIGGGSSYSNKAPVCAIAGSGSYGGGAGVGYGAGGGGGAVTGTVSYYSNSGTYYYNLSGAQYNSPGAGAPGVVIIELQ